MNRVSLPPRLSDIDIDYIVDRPPVWMDNPEWDLGSHTPNFLASIKSELSIESLEEFAEEGYSTHSWSWIYLTAPNDVALDEFGPLSLPEFFPANSDARRKGVVSKSGKAIKKLVRGKT